MKKYKLGLGLLSIMVVLGLVRWAERGRVTMGKDIKLAVIAESGIGMVSISEDRRMINSLKVEGEVEVWIPGGLGWYRSDRILRVLTEEGTMDKAGWLFFYNFGFTPDKVLVVKSFDDWNDDLSLWSQIGAWDYIRYKLGSLEMILNEEILNNQNNNLLMLGQKWTRDFADSGLLSDQMRVTVVNTTKESGLAGFVANRLEWAGITVVGLTNDDRLVDGCLLVRGEETKESLVYQVLESYLGCSQIKDEYLLDDEIELYLGSGYAEMINYLSYVRSF